MMSVAVWDILWLVSCSQIRGRPGERGACVEGGSGREGSGDVAGIEWVDVQRFCGPSFFSTIGNQACVGQWGRIHTPVALSSFIFFSTDAIMLKGRKA